MQNSGVIDYQALEKITNSGFADYIYKIQIEIKSNNQLVFKSGTGFFFKIPSKDYKFFLTNNTILNQEFIDKQKKLPLINKNGQKVELNLSKNRFKMTNSNLNFTIIEVLDEDNISNFFELDEFINSKDYKDEDIFTFDFQEGNNLQYLYGKCKGKNKEQLLYSSGVSGGSAIILKYNLKLIALHKGIYDQYNKVNSAIPIKEIIEKMNFIKCVYNIDDANIGKEIDIISKGYYSYSSLLDKMNIRIENEIKQISLKYKFYNAGKYNVYFIVKDEYIIYSIDMHYLFYQCSFLEKVNFSLFNPKNVEINGNIESLFSGCSQLKEIDLSFLNNCKMTNINNLFCNCKSLEKLNLSSLDTSKVTDMAGLFSDCEKLKNLDLSSFNTSNATSMNSMFHGCKLIEKLNLSSFNTNKVTGMSGMFYNCESLKELNLSSFNTSNVISMGSEYSGMFYNCKSLEKLNLSSFDTSKVTDMRGMFANCVSLKELNLTSLECFIIVNL